MKIIIGIGNPEVKYKNTRHNVGLMVVDKLLPMVKSQRLMVKKTSSNMNNSGKEVLDLINHQSLALNNLYIVHDDLDIPLGAFKIQFGKGPKSHNGLIDIDEKLGTNEYWHVRVGIEARTNDQRLKIKGEQYVLQDFTEEEMSLLGKVIKQICNQLVNL